MVSNNRYYARRASEELSRAARALTDQARERHRELAETFLKRIQEQTSVAA
jgi:hypothetical protein